MAEYTNESPSRRARRMLANVAKVVTDEKWPADRQLIAIGGPGYDDGILTVQDFQVLAALAAGKGGK